jgi:tetratricopeptide (TPR) repeat protein
MWKARKDNQRANAALEEALELAPDDTEIFARRMAWLVDSQQYSRAIEEADKYVDSPELWAVAKLAKASALAATERFEQADALFASVIKDATSDAVVRMAMARIIDAYEDRPHEGCEKAEAWIREYRPKQWVAMKLLGDMYVNARDHDAAVRVFKEALGAAADEKEVNATNMLIALTYQNQKKFPEAEKAYLALLEADPNEAAVPNNLAYLYAENLGNPQKAIEYAKLAMDKLPGNPNVMDTYAWALVRAGRYPEAIDMLERAIGMAPPSAIFYYHLGFAYEQAGRTSDARTSYEKGLEAAQASDNEEVRKNLQEAMERISAET